MDLDEGNKEQMKRMERYRKRVSKELGFDIGETGYYAWVEKYSARFREWVDKNPQEEGSTGPIGEGFREDEE